MPSCYIFSPYFIFSCSYVEPQIDLVDAMHLTVALNCVSSRVKVLHGALTHERPSELRLGARLHNISLPAFRTCLVPGEGTTQSGAGLNGAPFISIDAITSEQKHWDVVKLDIDSTDATIVSRLVDMIRHNDVDVSSFIVEWKEGAGLGRVLSDLQSLGYEIFRLNVHDNRRFINESGWDSLSGFQDIGIEPYFEELMQQRYMRYVLKVRHNIQDPQTWTEIASWGMMSVSLRVTHARTQTHKLNAHERTKTAPVRCRSPYTST